MPNGAAPAGSGVGDEGSSLRIAAVHREGADGIRAGVDDPELPAVRAEPSVLRPDARRTQRGTAEQAEGAVGGDRVAGDAVAAGVDREEDLPVVADLDPARRSLEVREGRRTDRRQRAVAPVAEGRDRPVARATVRIGNEQL